MTTRAEQKSESRNAVKSGVLKSVSDKAAAAPPFGSTKAGAQTEAETRTAMSGGLLTRESERGGAEPNYSAVRNIGDKGCVEE